MIACPVGIDTGAMMKGFRHLRHSAREERNAARIAKAFAAAESSVRAALAVADHLSDRVLDDITRAVRDVVSPELIPEWLGEIPGPASRRMPPTDRATAAAVYYVACVNRIFAGPDNEDLPKAIVEVSRRAGRPVWIPTDVVGSCCATIWHSKGYDEGNAVMANRIVEKAWEWTDHGRLPLVVDASSCTLGIAQEVQPYLTADNSRKHAALKVIDSIVWATTELLPNLTITRQIDSAVLHPTCSMRHLGDTEDLRAVTAACAHDVQLPVYADCCGFAGDRGMLHKELTESATRHEAEEVTSRAFDAHVSANRTCEIGMQHATGRPYHSVLIELELASRPSADQPDEPTRPSPGSHH
jgi:D-lactate dehydrogenase